MEDRAEVTAVPTRSEAHLLSLSSPLSTTAFMMRLQSTPVSKFNTARSASSTGAPSSINAADQSFTSTIATPPSPSPAAADDSPPSPSPASAHTSPVVEQATSALPSASQATASAGGAIAGAAAAVGLAGVAKTVADKTGAEVPASASISSTASDAELRAELIKAKTEIANLRKQLESAESTAAGLRSRGVGGEKVAVSSGGSVPGTAQAVVQQKGQEGVPVQIVIGIAVGVFVITWCVRSLHPLGAGSVLTLSAFVGPSSNRRLSFALAR